MVLPAECPVKGYGLFETARLQIYALTQPLFLIMYIPGLNACTTSNPTYEGHWLLRAQK